jgi:hypothetical protein
LPEGQTMSWVAATALRVWIEPSTWHPRFGVGLESQCLVVELCNGKSELRLSF